MARKMFNTKPGTTEVPIELPTVRTRPFDPPPELTAIREKSPLCPLRYPDGHVGWLVTSHALARAILSDSRFSMRPIRMPIGDAGLAEAIESGPTSSGDLLTMDPPEHTRLRSLQAGYFTVRRLKQHKPAIEEIVAECLDAMHEAGPPVDLVQAFALPVPSMSICEVLGVPRDDRDRFERPAPVLMDPEKSAEEKMAAMQDFFDYGRAVIKEKRLHPGNDLLSELIATGDLTDDELAGISFLLFGAGHHTTATMLALSTFVLLSNRDYWETLRSNPSLIQTSVEELLRYLTINQFVLPRTATEDVEVEGVLIRAGEAVTVSLPAANRDPHKFANPDRFDLSRDASGHLAFAHGAHMCLGQHLARLELQIALAKLIERFPTLRLAVSFDEVPLRGGAHPIFGVDRLAVTW